MYSLICVNILTTHCSILRNTLSIIMEASPAGVSASRVRDTFLAVEGIQQVHNLRIWSLTTDKGPHQSNSHN